MLAVQSDSDRNALPAQLVGRELASASVGERMVRFNFKEPTTYLTLYRSSEVRTNDRTIVRGAAGFTDAIAGMCGGTVTAAGVRDGRWLYLCFDRGVSVVVSLDGDSEDLDDGHIAVMRGDELPFMGVWVADGQGPPSPPPATLL